VSEDKQRSHQHVWRFFRAGGFDQVRIDAGTDVAHLAALDQKLWVALACPTRGIQFDERTLDLIDTDRDGRIRAPEMLAAVEWTTAALKDWNELPRRQPAAQRDRRELGNRQGDPRLGRNDPRETGQAGRFRNLVAGHARRRENL
jgi:hypothetical protein